MSRRRPSSVTCGNQTARNSATAFREAIRQTPGGNTSWLDGDRAGEREKPAGPQFVMLNPPRKEGTSGGDPVGVENNNGVFLGVSRRGNGREVRLEIAASRPVSRPDTPASSYGGSRRPNRPKKTFRLNG